MKRLLALAATTTIALSITGGISANAATSNEDAKIAEFQNYVVNHSTDYAGRDALAVKLFGNHEYVSFDNNPTKYTGTAAAKKIQVANSPTGGVTTNAIPGDAFSVSKSGVRSGTKYVVTGSWNFRDSWAGQATPTDVATLQFDMGSCYKFSSYAASTSDEDGNSTGRASLRSSGVSSKAPIWNISDFEKGFISQADAGAVSVTLDPSSCSKSGQVGYDFSYEANQGGSVVSASAGWGAFSVSYSNPGSTIQKSTTAGYFTL